MLKYMFLMPEILRYSLYLILKFELPAQDILEPSKAFKLIIFRHLLLLKLTIFYRYSDVCTIDNQFQSFSWRLLLGCLSLLRAFASICLIRSLVTSK